MKSPEFISYSIHWVAVQAYYAVYLQLRAYFLATGQEVAHAHIATLNAISNELAQKQNLFPNPWRTMCQGDPGIDMPCLVGVPVGTPVSQPSALNNYENCDPLSWYALFLKTTRQRQLGKVVDEWKKRQRRKRIPAAAKAELIQKLGPTSIFNAFYRLRIRSNYEDADSFLLGALHAEPHETKQFHQDICSIVWGTALLFEVLIARNISKNTYKELLAGFVKHDKLHLSKTLAFHRWQIMATAW